MAGLRLLGGRPEPAQELAGRPLRGGLPRLLRRSPPLGIPAPAAGCSGALQLVDLRPGRRRQPELAGLVSGLLLTARGALAFVDAGQLKKLDRDGRVTIDPGTGIDPESLASDGRHLYWLRGGQPQVADFR